MKTLETCLEYLLRAGIMTFGLMLASGGYVAAMKPETNYIGWAVCWLGALVILVCIKAPLISENSGG